MAFLNFENHPLWLNLAILVAGAIAVWLAGTRIARYADIIATRSGAGHVMVGLVLLGTVTSLPEIAIIIFSASGDASLLAINNVLGGISLQKAMLAAVDGMIGKDALTVVAASPAMLLQGVLGILLLALVAAAIVVGDVLFLGVGAWCWAILAMYVFSIWQIAQLERRQTWVAEEVGQQSPPKSEQETGQENGSLMPLVLKTIGAGAVILVAGFLLSRTGEAIAEQTGLGLSFVGAVLLAVVTSLPDLSTIVSSVRLHRYEMAMADILGGTLFNTLLIFLVDVVHQGKPVLNEANDFSLFASLIGIVLSVILLVGLIERKNRTIVHMGIDSLVILATYFGGLFLLYQLR